MEYLFYGTILLAIVALGGSVGYLFKIGLKEKTYEENAAEQKKKYKTSTKPKYTQPKKPVKAATKEKPNTEKRSKVTFQSPVAKDFKKIEPPIGTSGIDKTDGNVNVKKKPEKVQPKIADFTAPNANEKSQSFNNPSGKNANVESTNGKANNANNASQEESNNADSYKKPNNDKLVDNSSPPVKNDNNNNVPANKLNAGNDSTDNEDTDGSYNNDRTNSVSYYNSNTANAEKLLNKNKISNATAGADKKPENEEKQKSAASEATGSVKTQSQDKKKSKQENDESKPSKVSNKIEDRQTKDKAKKLEEKNNKNVKDASKDDKAKEKGLGSPSKPKKIEDKSKNAEPLVLANSSPLLNNSPNSVDEKEPKIKNDKKLDNEKLSNNTANVEQSGDRKVNENERENLNSNSSTKSEKNSHKKNNAASVGGKTSPIQNGKSNPANASKIIKRQATEIKVLQKITNDTDGPVNVNLLIPLIAKAELSHTEIQNLLDLLLNKQQEDCIIDAEWIEGSRQDPLVKLKKQLAEKEKLLSAEQEAHQAIQNKLKELRSELNVEKHNNRQLEESLNLRQVDFQTLNAKLQAAQEEKQNFAKQIQQLQAKFNDERIMMHSLKEESSKTKSGLQQELLSQRQQLEMHIAHLNEQHQQAIVTLESQLGQMAAQLQEQEAANAQMNEELRECVLLREQIAVQENQIAHLRQTATATQELVIQLEELRAIRAELDRRLTNSQFEVTQLSNELKSATEQLSRRNSEIDKFNCTVQNMKIENQELLKENARINEQINNAYSEKKQLQIENENLTEQLQQLKDQSKKLQEIDQLEKELNKYKSLVNEKGAEITKLNNQIDELKASLQQSGSRNVELEKQNKLVAEMEDNFKKQLKKNDELRCKNWKAMEALSTMEKSFENKVKEIRNLSHEIKVKEREELIQRLRVFLPSNVQLNSNTSVDAEDNVWFDYVENLLKEIRSSQQKQQQNSSPVEDKQIIPDSGKVNMLYELEKQNSKLQSMVSHYKGIISDTEGMLNSLQKHVECEENRWSEQVHVLESKLDVVIKERDLLLSTAKMQNGCLKNEENEVNEHKLNCDSKHSSILSADYS